MTDEAKTPEKKIIIDEGWKDQVEAERDAEKEAARRAAEAEKPAAAGPSPGPRGPLPPANLTFLISSLYLQGAMSLGLLLNPETQKPDVQLDQAKHSIDLLTMLQDKTNGNRTPEESAELEAALHELRLAYVQTQQ
jgi:hypothetical protein